MRDWPPRSSGRHRTTFAGGWPVDPALTVRIGTSGWSYDHWADVLYPLGLPAGRRLARYVEVFDTVELNASFYRWPKDSTFAAWRDQLPEGFTMSVKAHRGLTHYRRLSSPGPWIERFATGRYNCRSNTLIYVILSSQYRDARTGARY